METCKEYFYQPEELSVRAQYRLSERLGYKNPTEMEKDKLIKKIRVTVCDKKQILKECLENN